MRKNRAVFYVLFCVLCVSLIGCDKINFFDKKIATNIRRVSPAVPVKGPLVAKVHNIAITVKALNQEIDAYNDMVPQDKKEQKITTREQKIDYLKNETVRRVLLYQEALDRGLDTQEDIVRVLERTKMDLLVMALVKDESAKIDVPSKEVEDYYNTYKEQLKEPEERRISEIVVNSETDAKNILIQLLQGEDFVMLAKDKSKASSAKSGGDLGFIKKGAKFAQFDEIAFSGTLEIGKISSVFKGPDGYYIIKLEAKKGGKLRSLSEMWDDIKRGLTYLKQQQKLEDLIGRLSKDAKIEIYEGAID